MFIVRNLMRQFIGLANSQHESTASKNTDTKLIFCVSVDMTTDLTEVFSVYVVVLLLTVRYFQLRIHHTMESSL